MIPRVGDCAAGTTVPNGAGASHPARPSLACWHTLTLSAGRAFHSPNARFARRLNRLELALRPNQCAVSISRAKALRILLREPAATGEQAPWADSWKRNRTRK